MMVKTRPSGDSSLVQTMGTWSPCCAVDIKSKGIRNAARKVGHRYVLTGDNQ